MQSAFANLLLLAVSVGATKTTPIDTPCFNGQAGQAKDGPSQLVTDCTKCFAQQSAQGCLNAKFCTITGIPWCGPSTLGCDNDSPFADSAAKCAAFGPAPGPSPSPAPGPTPPQPPHPSGKCLNFEIDANQTAAALVQACEMCWDRQGEAGCSSPKFCSGITGYPYCGSVADMFCDNDANGVMISRGCCQKYTDHSIAWRCGGLPCPNEAAADASPKSCEKCFAQAADINCTSPTKTNGQYPGPAFCTSTANGAMPWCGPSNMKQYCRGSFITDATQCSSVGPGPTPPGPQPSGSFSQTHCSDANCSKGCSTAAHPQGQCLNLYPSGSAIATCTSAGLSLKTFLSSGCTGASHDQIDPIGMCIADGNGGSFENQCSNIGGVKTQTGTLFYRALMQ